MEKNSIHNFELWQKAEGVVNPIHTRLLTLPIPMKKLFLDDVRQPYDVFRDTIDPVYEQNATWSVVRSFAEFCAWITEHGVPDMVSFDHDLTIDHYRPEHQHNIDYTQLHATGLDAALWLIAHCRTNGVSLPAYRVHSANPEGRLHIEHALNAAREGR